MPNRRTFVTTAAALAGLNLTPGALLAATRTKGAYLKRGLNKGTFAALFGQQFTISTSHGSLVVKLVRIDDISLSPQLEQFSIAFRGPCNCRLSEGMYTVEHPHTGCISLFLKPVKEDPSGDYLGADFSLLRYA